MLKTFVINWAYAIFLKLRRHTLYPYETTGKITVSYIFTLTVLESRHYDN